MPNLDNQEIIDLLQERIEADLYGRIIRETETVCGILMSEGRHWRPSTRGSASGQPPHAQNDPHLAVATIDLIGPEVRHLHGRLRVEDFGGSVTGPVPELLGAESPALARKIDWAQQYWWRWTAAQNFREMYNYNSYRRILAGYSLASWLFPPKGEVLRTGGLKLQNGVSINLTLDPANANQDLWDHEYAVVAEAVSLEQARRDYGLYLPDGGKELKSGTPLRDLITSDRALNGVLHSMQPGAGESKALGLVVYRMFDEFWKMLYVVTFSPAYADPKTRKRVDAEYRVVWKGAWEYGCPLLKLDCYTSLRSGFGRSFVMALMPQQELVSRMVRVQERSVLAHAMMKILVMSGALDAGAQAELESNRPFGIIRLNRTSDVTTAVRPLEMPRFDGPAGVLMQNAIESLYRSSALSGVTKGDAKSHTTASGFSQQVREALMPLEPLALQDQQRFERWASNAIEAAQRRYGTKGERRLIVPLFGPRFADLAASVSKAREVVEAGRIQLKMRDGAWLPQTVDEIQAEMFELAKAGHYGDVAENPEFGIEYFLRTGREMKKGQNEVYNEATEVVRLTLTGTRVTLDQYDPLEWIEHEAKRFRGTSRTRHLTVAQRLGLGELLLQIEQLKFENAKMKGVLATAEQGVLAGQLGEPANAASPTGPATAPNAPGASNASAVEDFALMAG